VRRRFFFKKLETFSSYSREYFFVELSRTGIRREKSVGELQKETNIMGGGMKWDGM
jgi:hypothetical protein